MSDRLSIVRSALGGLRRRLALPDREDDAGLLPLSAQALGDDDVAEAVLALIEGRVTMGERVRRFEAAWSRFIGVEHSVMVNSGSSANLLALKALQLDRGERFAAGAPEVVTSPVTWSTSVFPIYDVGALPHFTDVEVDGFRQPWATASRAVGPRTAALLPVHLMGIPTDIDVWADEAEDRRIPLVEDCCEAAGASRQGRALGTFGDASTFSFFFSHHITTMEGGMVCTDDRRLSNTLRSLRAHGWIRERSDRAAIARRHPSLDPRFLFLHHGYNVRPTEIQAAIGLHQLPRLRKEVRRRERILASWRRGAQRRGIPVTTPQASPGDRAAWFGIPLILPPSVRKSRTQVARALERAGIDTRPIMGGNFVEHPAARRHGYHVTGKLPNAGTVARRGLYMGMPSEANVGALDAVLEALSAALR